jgi:ATP-dependent DNA helicase PIF1
MLKSTRIDTGIPNKIYNEMLSSHLDEKIETDYTSDLSEKQKMAFELYRQGKNVLMMGPSGVGKTKCIKIMSDYTINECPDKNIRLTSTTAISAYSINGTTIHSLLGIGTGELPIEDLIRKVSRKKMYVDQIRQMDIIILDEISMLSASLFEKINILLQTIRKNKLHWGGIQVVLTGDFLQLEVVFNSNNTIYKDQDRRLLIESPVYQEMFTLGSTKPKKGNIIILDVNFRQKADPEFKGILNRIRDASFTEDDITLLKKYQRLPDLDKQSQYVHLVCTNKKADLINQSELFKLKERDYIFDCKVVSPTLAKNAELSNLLIKEMEHQFRTKGLLKLVLRKGARVMLVKNLDISTGLVNGSIGTVVNFIGAYPNVLFDNSESKRPVIITPVSWELEMSSCKATSEQVPLILAYSINVHKCQGQTLDSAIIDIGDAFCNHMVYVALSRVKSLEGLYLKTFNPDKITCNAKIVEYLKKF